MCPLWACGPPLLTAVVVGGTAGAERPVAGPAARLAQRTSRLDAALPAADTEAVLAAGRGEHRRAVGVHGAFYRAAACATPAGRSGQRALMSPGHGHPDAVQAQVAPPGPHRLHQSEGHHSTGHHIKRGCSLSAPMVGQMWR